MCSDLRFGLLVEGCWQCLAKSGIEASLFIGMSNMGEDLLFGFLPDCRHAMVGGLRLLSGYKLVAIRSLRDRDSCVAACILPGFHPFHGLHTGAIGSADFQFTFDPVGIWDISNIVRVVFK
jgi:hypothetical protein